MTDGDKVLLAEYLEGSSKDVEEALKKIEHHEKNADEIYKKLLTLF